MKKSITRIGALLLVLALLVSAAPFALAAGEITITSNDGKSEIEVGKTLLLTTTYEGTVTWTSDNDAVATVSAGLVSGVSAGTATITATDTADSTKTGTFSVTVKEPAAEIPGQLTISGGNQKIEYGASLTLSAVDAEGKPVTGVTWESSNSEVATINPSSGAVTTEGVGQTIITAKPAEGESASIQLEVTKKTLTVQITNVPSSVIVGDSVTLGVSLGVEGLKPETETWKSDKQDVIFVDAAGKIEAKTSGEAKISVTVTLSEADQALYTLANDGKAESEISVGGVVLNVNLADKVERLKSVTLTPSVSGLPENAVVNYTFTPSNISSGSGGVSVTPTSVSNDKYKGAVSVQGTSVGVAAITVSAVVSGNNDIEIDPVTVHIGVYDTHTVKASTDTWKIKFSDTGVLKTLYKDNGSNVAKQRSLISVLGANNGEFIKVTVTDGKNVGSFSGNSSTGWESVYNCPLTFTAIRNGTVKATYTVAAYRDKTYYVVSEGTLELTIGDAEGDIEYDLGSNGKVTFDESDFVRFWNDNKSANKYTGSLSYVKFDITTSVPYYGILYTTSSASKVVTTGHRAYYNYSSTNNNSYCDLDQVTYVVDTKNYEGLTDTVPFTAYNDKGDGISGIIVINLGEGDAATITSRGVAFGTGGITEIIEANYKAATGKDLDYLTFSSVSASSGKLFYNFSNVLNSTPVTTKYEFYVDPTGTQMDLDKVAFVPRAGLYGEVSIKYTGYDVNGKNSYEGKITFKVTQKTKSAVFSDVTATSYSWAADSVDFLYYEEVANGSNGKYNPKSNITRGDFMLMLYRAFLEEDYGNYNVTSNFPDVVKGTTSYSKETYQAVGVAKYLGIAQGSNGKYNPTSYITREEAMTLIYRTLDEVGYSMNYTVSTSTSSFSDYSSVSSYAQAAIKDLIGHGVVIGTNGKIQPKSNITRAEMAVILHRVLTY